MYSMLRGVVVSVGLVAALAAVNACGSGEKQICQGYEQCACYPNMTCNEGLACTDGLCVNPLGQGGGSNTGGANPGSGGASGAAGTSSGGSTAGEGGSNTSGASSGGSGGASSGGSGGASSGGSGGVGAGGAAGGTSGSGGGSVGPNLITNGDFSNDKEFWNTDGASANNAVTDGVWCGSFLIHGAHVVLGWPDDSSQAVALSGQYNFSFKMSLSGQATIIAKVGLAVAPYTPDFQTTVTPTETLSTFSYTFTANDAQAGVAFDVTGNSPPTTVCIDDVVLAPAS